MDLPLYCSSPIQFPSKEWQRHNYTKYLGLKILTSTSTLGTIFSQIMAAAYLSCGRDQGVALQPSPSETCDTLPVHRLVGSG